MDNNREMIHSESVKTWCSNPKSTLNKCTGSGKTRDAIAIIKIVVKKIIGEGKRPRILIVTPTEIIRDTVFPSEFKKWGCEELLQYCEIKCIQTVYKYKDQEFSLVVCDEIHNYLYEYDEPNYEYFKFFENNKYRYILGLSASIDTKRLHILNKIAPISYVLTLDKAVKLGIVSPFKIYNVKVSLNQEELATYKTVQRSYNYYEMLLGGRFDAYRNSNIYLGKDYTAEQRIQALAFKSLIKKRKSILDNAFNKISCTKRILECFPDSNGLIFSESIIQSEKLIENNEKAISYHSGLKKPQRLEAIRKLNDGRTKIRVISAVKALNEGLSIDSIEFAIITAGNSKVKDMIQRIGRTCRYVEGKQSYMFRLYVEGTQEEKWVTSSQREFDRANIFHVTEQELWTLLKQGR